jgi:hypothetical protein
MTLAEIEAQVQSLPRQELLLFANWFDAYREIAGDLQGETEAMVQTYLAQKEEILRRKEEYLAESSSATAWDDSFFDRLRQSLVNAGGQKTEGR